MTAETENTLPTAEIIEIVETDEEKAKREEREKLNRRYELARQVEERVRMISALLDQLADPQTTKAEFGVIGGMLARNYSAALALIREYRELGGDHWGVDRGLFRHLFGTN